MPSLLSKFSKSPNGKLEEQRDSPSGHQRAHTSIESTSNPRLVLTSDSNDSFGRPPTPGSIHRAESLLTTAGPAARNVSNFLYPDDDEGRSRKAFAERMKEGNNRRALSLGTQTPPGDNDLTPGPRRPPSRQLPEPPSVSNSSASEPLSEPTDIPPPRSRRNSATSQPPMMVESPPAMQAAFPTQQGPISSPTSEDGHSLFSVSASPPQSKDKERKGWRRGSQSSQKAPKGKRGTHPSGGLASALAGSGLALANHAMQQPLVPPLPPRPRQNSSTSDLPPRQIPRRDRHAHAAGSRKSSLSLPSTQEGPIDDTMGNESGSSEENSDDDESSPDDLDLTEGAAPITGFAVASNKRTADFHALFPTVPEGDYLIDDYGCALQREILIQGRLYISENHICFHANIFGWTTDLVVPIEDITHVDKRMTAYVIPNAIQISTHTGKYTFASLLNRDTTYDVIFNIWRSVRPEGSFPDSPRGSLDGVGQTISVGSVTDNMLPPPVDAERKATKARKATRCACGKEGRHYPESAMETVVPGDPEKIYNLMFASGFMKDFMRNDEKLMDIQISDWAPISQGSKMLTRNMSYIKPLAGGLGPKQTKCELKDEMVHLDYDDYVTMLTTTRTPDVPSGNVFSVKTRTCIMWAGSGTTRIIVTTQVEWTGRSFIKGIIERSAIDGQKTYHASLEGAMRAYIAAHKTEFVAEGEDVAAVEEAVLAAPTSPGMGSLMSSEDIRKAKEKERSQRGLQWALDTVEGTAKVAQQSFWGAIELIKDTWESSSTTAVLWFVVVGLVLSNIWTYFRAGRLEAAARRRATPRREEDIQRVVGESVRDAFKVFEEVVRGDGKSIVEEVADVKRTLEAVDARVKKVEEQLAKLD